MTTPVFKEQGPDVLVRLPSDVLNHEITLSLGGCAWRRAAGPQGVLQVSGHA